MKVDWMQVTSILLMITSSTVPVVKFWTLKLKPTHWKGRVLESTPYLLARATSTFFSCMASCSCTAPADEGCCYGVRSAR